MLNRWKNNCLSKMSEDNINSKLNLFSKIANDIDKTNKKMLLVGSVQSGKTATFIGLTAYLFENKISNLVILFCGNTNKLKDQTITRFNEIFDGCQNVKVVISKRGVENFDEAEEALAQGKNVVILSIKHYKHIEKIANWFNSLNENKINPLIVDDEGDQASFYNLKMFSKKGKHSATYAAFTKFFDIDNNCSFLSVTATPQAHILAHREFCKLDPDYVYLIPDGEGYLTYQNLESEPGVFKTLSDDDVEQLMTSKVGKDEFTGKTIWEVLSIPHSAYLAIIDYLVNHQRRYYEQKKQPYFSQMIINVDKMIVIHQKVGEYVEKFLFDFEHSEEYRKAIIKELYWKLSDKTQKLYENYALEILQNNDYEIRYLNCYNDVEKYREIEGKGVSKQCNVIIGGLTLSRGLSFPNLLAFYYINDKAKNYTMDNIIQVCRFLGYRESYLSYFSIWMSRKIQDVLSSMFNADQWIREKICFFQNHHINFKKAARYIRIQIKSDADYGILGVRETVAKQYAAKGIGKSLANDASFDFKSKEYRSINDRMHILLDFFIKKYLISSNKKRSVEYGEKFSNYPIIEFENFNDLQQQLKNAGIEDLAEILKNYFKGAVYCKDVIDKLQNSSNKLVIALMLYEFNNDTGDFVSRNISYSKGAKEFSFYRQGYRTDYIGDNNWADEIFRTTNESVNFIQLFSLNVPKPYDLIFDDTVIKMQIVLPNETESEIYDTTIYATDEDIENIENDIYETEKSNAEKSIKDGQYER